MIILFNNMWSNLHFSLFLLILFILWNLFWFCFKIFSSLSLLFFVLNKWLTCCLFGWWLWSEDRSYIFFLFLLLIFLIVLILLVICLFIWFVIIGILILGHIQSISIDETLLKFLSDSLLSLQVPSVDKVPSSGGNNDTTDHNSNDGTSSDSAMVIVVIVITLANNLEWNLNWSKIAVCFKLSILSSIDVSFCDNCNMVVDFNLSDEVLFVMNGQQPDSSEGIWHVSGESEVEIKSKSALFEFHTS